MLDDISCLFWIGHSNVRSCLGDLAKIIDHFNDSAMDTSIEVEQVGPYKSKEY